MDSPHNLHDRRLADAWATLKSHSDSGLPLQADATRLAFADPEFLLRRETRGIRFQLELLKPDLEQQQQGIENTIVVFGSARFRSREEADALLQAAQAGQMVAKYATGEQQHQRQPESQKSDPPCE